MNNLANPSPKWLINLLPFISGMLSGGALWYTWFTYNNMANEPEFYWYAWIRLVLMIIMGILCLLATILFILNKPSAQAIFMGGLSMIPVILFSNLVILIFRIIQNILQENIYPFLSRLSTNPFRTILTIIVIILLLSVIDRIKKSQNNK